MRRFAGGLAYLRAALTRRQHPPDMATEGLRDQLRRDIGLNSTFRQNEQGRQGWDF